jgi:hypothetical protein
MVGAFAVSYLVAGQWEEPVGGGLVVADLFRDPAAIAGVSSLAGSASMLGLLIWAGAAAICFTGATLLRQGPGGFHDVRFLLTGGALLVLALLDDAYLLHERVAGQYLGGEEVFLAVYLVLGSLWVVAFLPQLRESDVSLLLVALLAFGASAAFDLTDYPHISEDALELIGSCALYVFFLNEVRWRLFRRTTGSGHPVSNRRVRSGEPSKPSL